MISTNSHDAAPSIQHKPSSGTVSNLVLVGNPNVGKSVIFGILTGTYVTVSNYPGTTVEVSRGFLSGDGPKVRVIDTPGVNSLLPNSEDEQVTREILLESLHDCVVLQVGDAKNLSRTLNLTLQLIELELPLFLCLNMDDEAASRGIEIDSDALAARLGIPVAKTVAHRRQGTARLFECLNEATRSPARPRYSASIEKHAATIEGAMAGNPSSNRALSLMLLSGDSTLRGWLHSKLDKAAIEKIELSCRKAEMAIEDPISYAISLERMSQASQLAAAVTRKRPARSSGIGERLGRLMTKPVEGTLILLLVLWLIYLFVGKFGAQTLVELFEVNVFQRLVNPTAIALVDRLLPFAHSHGLEEGVVSTAYEMGAAAPAGSWAGIARLLHDLAVGEYGILTMAFAYSLAIVLPIVATFFLAFGVLEDSGYLPRLAVVVNQVFKKFGLNGKAILPMILGLGCDTMATLTTRLLETRKERTIVILLLTLGVPCSAQLGVILGLLGPLPLSCLLIWLGVVVGSLGLTGYAASRVLPGDKVDLILELPPIRLPGLRNIAVKTFARIEWYLKEAVPLFILGTLVLFTLDRLELLVTLRKLAAPVVVRLLSLPVEAADAFVIGFLRRDFGAAGLYVLAEQGRMDHVQTLVGLITITLFVPCIAQFFITIKEQGLKVAAAIALFVFPFAILVGAAVNFMLRAAGVTF